MKKGIGVLVFLAMVSCKEKVGPEANSKMVVEEKEAPQEWVSLMEADKWRGFNQSTLPSNWAFKGDIIECYGEGGDIGGDIISKEQYDNFEMSLEWKITEGGNSGVFYHVVEDAKYKAPYETGAEYQLLDDVGFPSPIEDWQKTGANYAMHLANDKKVLNPVGEWNTSSLSFNNGKAEHWLNGHKIVEFDKFTEDWRTRRNSGKWTDFPDYGIANKGYIGLQDHGAGVWFRNVKIRKL